jgi:hypothetical protein
MSDYYETALIEYENKQDILHDYWNKKYYAYIEAFEDRLKSEDDVLYNDWVNTLDELLDLIKIHHHDKLKIRVTRYKRTYI